MKLYVALVFLIANTIAHAMNQLPDKEQFQVHYAAATNDLNKISKLIEGKSRTAILQHLTKQDDQGRLPLHWAAENGYNYVVSYITVTLQGCYGDNVNAVTNILNQCDHHGRTAAQLAYEKDLDSVVDNLVFAGAADPRTNSNTSFAPLTTQTIASQPISSTINRYVAKVLLGFMMFWVIGAQFVHHTHQQSFSDLD